METNKQFGVCDGLVDVSTLVDECTQSFNQTLIYLGVSVPVFADVVNICNQLTLGEEIILDNVSETHLIS